jgi:hypothetical protein
MGSEEVMDFMCEAALMRGAVDRSAALLRGGFRSCRMQALGLTI